MFNSVVYTPKEKTRPVMSEKEKQANNPMHGITLEKIVNSLVEHYGWGELGMYVKIRCFNSRPVRKIQPEIPAKDAVGQEKSRGIIPRNVAGNG